MQALDAIERVLRDAGKPLHYHDITREVIAGGLWRTDGQTPDNTINAALAVDIQERGSESRFRRTQRGVFELNPAVRTVTSVEGNARDQAPGGAGPGGAPRASISSQRLSGDQIRGLARAIVRANPQGIRYGQLLATILDQYPATNRNTVQGAIWNLDDKYPSEISKPARGIFVPMEAREPPIDGEAAESPGARVPEKDFYEPFADWLKSDLEEATDACPLGGAALRLKWGTPDVIGTYKPRKSARIKFEPEIVSAEIKVDPTNAITAFGQAISYRLFSTKSYVVMPNTVAKDELDRLDALCMLFGVGLVVFALNTNQPDFQIRVRAQRSFPDAYFVNEVAESIYRHDPQLYEKLF